MNKISTWLFICIVSTFFFTCTAEKDKGDYLKGRILLDGQPSGGILVRLYDYPQVNDTLEYLQSQYPGIGVKVTRQLNFDKNALPVIREVYSDKNGNWEMDNLSTGSFVVVYLKEGLCKNQYGVTVGSGGSNAGDFDFGKPFIYKNDSTITGNVIWPVGSSVYIEGKIVVDEMATLTVEPGVSIAFSDSAAGYPKGELAIYGKAEFVGTEQDYITFTGLGELKNAWNGVKVGSYAIAKFNHVVFKNSSYALNLVRCNIDVSNALFINNSNALYIDHNLLSSFNFSKNSFVYNKLGVIGNGLDNTNYYITNCSFYNNSQKGLDLYELGNRNFKNLVVHNNNIGACIYRGITNITNSVFDNNTIAFNLLRSSGETTINNSIISNSGASDFKMISIMNRRQNLSISNSNISSDAIFLSIDEQIGNFELGPKKDFNLQNNWFGGLTDSLSIIANGKIVYNTNYNPQTFGNFLFHPVRLNSIGDAGISY